MKPFHIFFTCSLLLGCASKPIEPETLVNIKEIHIASTLPEAIAVHFIGTTIFQNNVNLVKLQAWDAENFVLNKYEAHLDKKKLKLKLFSFNKEQARKALEESQKGLGGFLAGHFPTEYEPKAIIEEAKSKGIKHLLLIMPIGGGDNYPQHAPGYGLFCKSTFGLTRNAEAYTLYEIELWNTQTEDRIFRTHFTPNTSNIKTANNCKNLEKKELTEVAKIGLPSIQASFDRTIMISLQEMGYLPKPKKKK